MYFVLREFGINLTSLILFRNCLFVSGDIKSRVSVLGSLEHNIPLVIVCRHLLVKRRLSRSLIVFCCELTSPDKHDFLLLGSDLKLCPLPHRLESDPVQFFRWRRGSLGSTHVVLITHRRFFVSFVSHLQRRDFCLYSCLTVS